MKWTSYCCWLVLCVWICPAQTQDELRWAHICAGSALDVRCPNAHRFTAVTLYRVYRTAGCSSELTGSVQNISDCYQENRIQLLVDNINTMCKSTQICTLDFSGGQQPIDNCRQSTLNNMYTVSYTCTFDSSITLPPTTTTTTTTTTEATTVTTTREPTEPAANTTTTTASATTRADNSSGLSTTEDSTSILTTPQTGASRTTRVSSPNTPSQGVTSSIDDEAEKTKLIIGVSVASVVLLIIIIVLVECKRQTRNRRRCRKDDEAGLKEGEASDFSNSTDNGVDNVVRDGSGPAVESDERVRRFKKKNETENEHVNASRHGGGSPVKPEAEIETDGGDSGVVAMFSEESTQGYESDGKENDDYVQPDLNPERRDRHVSFSDMAINTDIAAVPRATDNRQEAQAAQHKPPQVNPEISGPSTEKEVLY